VRFGLIVGAFIADQWLEATNENFPSFPDRPGRYGFKGHEAPKDLADLYIGKRVPDHLRKRGSANPIRYAVPPGANESPCHQQPPETSLQKIERAFHALIQIRTNEFQVPLPEDLPSLTELKATESNPAWFGVDGMYGGFRYFFQGSPTDLNLVVESWSRVVDGSGQRHLITPTNTELMEEGMV
jgi:hypothetical protein